MPKLRRERCKERYKVKRSLWIEAERLDLGCFNRFMNFFPRTIQMIPIAKGFVYQLDR